MNILVGLATAVAVACVTVAVGALIAVKRGAAPADLRALLPSLARLLVGLLRDRSLPWRVRARILIAVTYSVQPLNLIPDFIPVIGFADNVIVTAWAIRSTVRRAGREVVVRHWSGSLAGLAMVFRLAGLEEESDSVGA